MMRVQTAWIESNFYFRMPQIYLAQIFKNANNSVEHLQTGALVKCYKLLIL